MISSPQVSVIIPCYNHGRFLGQAIASVWQSACHPVEIVVVDDGSSDDTAMVAQSFATVRYVWQPNGGRARARNRGLRESTGAYVVFLDADDCLAPGALDIGAAELTAHPLSAFVFGRCHMIAADGTALPAPVRARVKRDHYRELLRRNYIWMPAMAMFRRAAVERAGGFDPSFGSACDYRTYLRIARISPVHDHFRHVADYRRRGQTTTGRADRMLRENLAVLRSERRHLENDTQSIDAYRAGIRNWQEFYGPHLVSEIRAHLRAHEWPQAIRKTGTLGRLHPRGLALQAHQNLVKGITRSGSSRARG